jgi:site-specific DNA-methyltransferase (cytosine-N4-specific)
MTISQPELFANIAAVYADSDNGDVSNAELYDRVADRMKLSASTRKQREKVGTRQEQHNLFHRSVRWQQQNMRHLGLIERVKGERGIWSLIAPSKRLHTPIASARLLAFSTRLGMAVWGDSLDTLKDLQEPVHLLFTSTPYLLNKARDYGNPTNEAEFVDFIVAVVEPVMRTLVPGGSVCLNMGQDAFVKGMPARSLFLERVTLALHDRLGLWLMDRSVWHNPTKPPGPLIWASRDRVQLNSSFEFVLWFTNDPRRVRADNRRVLEPHTEQHQKLIAKGGEQRKAQYGDGAYTIRHGSFGGATPGRIPRNVMTLPHRCRDTQQLRRIANELGLPTHGATFPTRLPDFWIRFLTEPGDLVLDACGGWGKTALAAQRLQRRWLIVDKVLDYLRASGEMFRHDDGFDMPPIISTWPKAA